MPDVRMPDGTIIRNVPPGTTRAQLLARVNKANAMAKPAPTLASRALNAIGINSPGARGFGDSRAFGFLDEAGAVLDTLGVGGSGENRPNIWKGDSFSSAYHANQRRNAQQMAESQAADPGSFFEGQVAGAVLPGPSSKILAGTRAGQTLRAAQTGAKSRAVRAAATAAPDVVRGAAYGAGSANGGIGERLAAAPEAAALGLGGHAAGRVVGKVATNLLHGVKPSPAVQTLADAGVVMTPGRRGGPIRRGYEETVLGSLPFVKAIPGAANARSVKQLNVAAYNQVLEPIGQKLSVTRTKPGRETVDALNNTVYTAYDAAASRLGLGMDTPLTVSIARIANDADATVGAMEPQLHATIARTLAPLQKGRVSGNGVRTIMSDLRGQASKYARSPVASEQNFGQELWRFHDALDQALARQNGGPALKAFQSARESVTRLKRVNSAVAASKDGVFSPGQFRQAVTRRGYGTTTDKVARGQARMQELADAAAQVLPNITPNSGSPERLIATSLMTGAPTSIATLIHPAAAVPVGAHLMGYAPGIDKILQDFALKRPDVFRRIGGAVERAGPALGSAGAITAVSQNK